MAAHTPAGAGQLKPPQAPRPPPQRWRAAPAHENQKKRAPRPRSAPCRDRGPAFCPFVDPRVEAGSTNGQPCHGMTLPAPPRPAPFVAVASRHACVRGDGGTANSLRSWCGTRSPPPHAARPPSPHSAPPRPSQSPARQTKPAAASCPAAAGGVRSAPSRPACRGRPPVGAMRASTEKCCVCVCVCVCVDILSHPASITATRHARQRFATSTMGGWGAPSSP
eukprot:COSAG01_NODE_12516_length_1726_cov_4.880762_2_plen_222_part_00